ncbi:TRAP transporter small permease [Pelobacter seleniigenes]|uniref:TRAP transporter small permease n=1 Tax=Pelobacter seleniigenes TaxID=407188 RepID=UPI0004A78752|nr:TRAP transporter small permease [Pelobacter seleniigenes]
MKALLKFSEFCDGLNRQIARLSAFILFAMLIFSSFAVFFRYIMGDALNWAEDVLLPAFVWVSLLGTSVAFRYKSHICVDSIQNLMPALLQRQLNRLIQLSILSFCIYLSFQGVKVVLATRGMPWGILQLPPTYFYVSFPISFFVIFLYALDDFLRSLVPPSFVPED